jgi:hypothetical protein
MPKLRDHRPQDTCKQAASGDLYTYSKGLR